MKKNLKRMFALLFMAVMLTGLCACSKEKTTTQPETQNSPTTTEPEKENMVAETKDPITLEFYYRGNGQQQDTEKVQERVNELLKEYPGLEHVSINLNCSTGAEYPEHVSLAESAGQQIDLLSCVSLDFTQKVREESYMPLNDLISNDLKTELPEWLWDLGSVDGNIYIVPNYQQAANKTFLFTPKEYMDKYGDYDKIKDVLTNPSSTWQEIADVMAEYLIAVREGEGDTKYLPSLGYQILTSGGTQGFYFCDNYFDVFSNNFCVERGSNKVEYRLTSDKAKAAYSLAAEWYDKGYIYPDILTVDPSELRFKNMLNPKSWILSYNGAVGDAESVAKTYSETWGFDVVAIPCQQQYYISNTWAAGGTGIHSTCKNPEEAIKFLEALTTGTEIGKEIYNTLVFGIEGTHYVKSENDSERIETLEYSSAQGGVDTSYAGLRWILGNTFYAYKNQAITDTQNDLAIKVNEGSDTLKSELAGFTVDTNSISMQLEQVNAVVKEYEAILKQGVLGTAGWEAYYNEFEKKLKAAGVEDIVVEYQKQLDEYLAKK